jgi:hypothetical protein
MNVLSSPIYSIGEHALRMQQNLRLKINTYASFGLREKGRVDDL